MVSGSCRRPALTGLNSAVLGIISSEMPRKDAIHDAVKHALIKDGWVITDDPLFLEFGNEDMFVDLGAERLLAAERDNERIAVEVKGFVGPSAITELHAALGQYQVYFAVLEKVDPSRKLYIAVSKSTYEELAEMDTFELVVERFRVSLLIVRIADEEIDEWKK
jgi:hypothetical protein